MQTGSWRARKAIKSSPKIIFYLCLHCMEAESVNPRHACEISNIRWRYREERGAEGEVLRTRTLRDPLCEKNALRVRETRIGIWELEH